MYLTDEYEFVLCARYYAICCFTGNFTLSSAYASQFYVIVWLKQATISGIYTYYGQPCFNLSQSTISRHLCEMITFFNSQDLPLHFGTNLLDCPQDFSNVQTD